MNKPLEFNRIFMPNPNQDNDYPTYQNKLQPELNFEATSVLGQLYEKHEANLIDTAVEECKRYLDDECWMEENTFPCVKELTGEWYLSSVYMMDNDGKIRIALDMHFPGYYPNGCAREEVDDYLGMQAWFDYDSAEDRFIFDCFDTDAI